MKNYTTLLFLILSIASSNSQNQKFEVLASFKPSTTLYKLSQAKSSNDISTDLCRSMILPAAERNNLDQRRIEEYPQPENYVYPQDKYKQIVHVIATNISIIEDGKTISAQNEGENLSHEQKSILKNAKLGGEVHVKIKFVYKDQQEDKFGDRNRILEGESILAIIPDKEAEFPGGYAKMTNYMIENLIHKLDDKSSKEKIQLASMKLMINEKGEIAHAELVKSTKDATIDQMLLDVTRNMPLWNPAMSSQGVKLKQEILIQFGREGC